jgi:hypothetical protein
MIPMTTKVKAIGIALALLLTILLPGLAAGGPDENIHCIGTVRDTWVRPGARGWEVAVDEVISGPAPCSEITVVLHISPPFPWGQFDENLIIGDHVDVYGRYNHSQCTVYLNGDAEYHILKIPKPVSIFTPLGLGAVVCVLVSVAMSKTVRRKRR